MAVLAANSTPAQAGPRRAGGRLAVLGWSLSALLVAALVSLPVSTAAQGWLGLGCLLAMVAVRRVVPGKAGRLAFIAVGSLVVLRYLVWRLSGTLPPLSDPVSFGFGLILLAAELYCVAIFFISLLVNIDPVSRRRPPPLSDAALPTVDVFVPSYNEDAGILSATLAAACAMDYPAGKLTVWLLDDGGTDQKCGDPDPVRAEAARERRRSLQALCRDLGCRYATRARNEHAKAGNLNNGLQASQGEIVVVFDADHAPFRSFLRETVGHFAADERLFLVQTPHVFLNPDPVERNLRTFQRMPSENEMFYALTQRGLDKWNGSFFCGSAALLRRAALETVGGFSGITITEDCETAFELHARGWTSLYVDTPLIAGLQPETFDSFIGQRSRWCQGMFQILLLKNPATRRGLSLIQRVCYLSSMLYWFFPLPRLVFMLAPLLHVFFDLKIFVSSLDEAVAFTGTYVAANMLLQNGLYGRVRWPWVSELYEYLQGVYLAEAIVAVVASPRKPTFNVTAKGLSLAEDHVSPLAWPYVAIFLLLLAGSLTAAWRYAFEPGVTSLMLVVGIWTTFNLVLAGAALGAVAERRQTEEAPGLAIQRPALLRIGTDAVAVTVTRVSAVACAVVAAPGAPALTLPPGPAHLEVAPPAGVARAPLSLPVTIPVGPGGSGPLVLSIRRVCAADHHAFADLMYGEAPALTRFLHGRRRHKGLLAGSLQVIAWSLTEPLRLLGLSLASQRAARANDMAAQADVPLARALAHPVDLPMAPPVPVPPAGAPPAPEKRDQVGSGQALPDLEPGAAADLSRAHAQAALAARTDLVGARWLQELADVARRETAPPRGIPQRMAS